MHKDELFQKLKSRPGAGCVVEFDASGKFTSFGADAVDFFRCPASDAIGKIHYAQFHEAAELEACHGDEEFIRKVEMTGASEGIWTVLPMSGDPFRAKVILHALDKSGENRPMKKTEICAWLALYRRESSATETG